MELLFYSIIFIIIVVVIIEILNQKEEDQEYPKKREYSAVDKILVLENMRSLGSNYEKKVIDQIIKDIKR